MPDLLIELFSEEIPARMQARARDDLKRLVTDGLVEAGLTYAAAHALSTPRRLVLAVDGLTAASRAQREERKGPAVGAPEAALQGFLRATGLTMDRLERRAGAKGEAWFAVIETPGRGAADIVAEVLEAAIRNFPWPKSMRWGAGSLRWVRPLHGVLCILTDEHGAAVVPLELDGIRAGTVTRGHRFLAPEPFSVVSFDDYAAKLKRSFVMLDPAARAEHIWNDAQNAAFAAGLELVEDKGLLAEVAGLVEWPVVLIGRIDEAFLDLPAEVLQTSMREHQKFFSAMNPKTGRIEGFVTVANTETADHGATILAGNQKVLSARLSDAKFFWENDLRTVAEVGLEGMAAGLANVTFHGKLGSQADRIARIEALAREIAPLVGASPDLAAEAARVAKADLQSAMVGEFPELQGTMGGYYARAAGLPEAVANACKAHYQPLGPSDDVPTDPVSVAVALADKIDTLTGFWAIDEKPTGSKDPFALRRAALGVIRLVLGNGVRLNLLENVFIDSMSKFIALDRSAAALAQATLLDQLDSHGLDETIQLAVYGDIVRRNSPEATDDEIERALLDCYLLLAFLHDRLKVHLRDQGIRHDVIDACLAPSPLAATSAAMPGNDDLTLLVNRATALAAFLKSDDGTNLLQGFKRANNILTQAEEKDGVEYSFGPDPKFAEGPEERALFAALDTAEATIAPALKSEDFATAMAAMARLRAPIDAFFDQVQVNADNQTLRRNRLNLLSRIRQTCLAVADLTRIEG
ncbi:MAG: glycine--tRNA ligase subunit beta [Alphaproteobacteria bacterium HGW-Alphaproteobacteria-6]|nr:MAG: glycine--tRNA ligase subunit beta [Alphaproteobacteria bacterium HGW-Alphaproteobacteria-6]